MRYQQKTTVFLALRHVAELVQFVNATEGHYTERHTAAMWEKLRAHLTEIARGVPLSQSARDQLMAQAERVRISPSGIAADGLSLDYKAAGSKGALYCLDTLQLNRLRQTSPNSFPGDLRQCANCKAFFFLSQTLPDPSARGRRSPCCGPKCANERRSKLSTARVQEWREKQRRTASKHK